MTKLEVQQRVLKDGKPLDLDLFTWDEKAKVFSSLEDRLVLDFKNNNSCTFRTGSACTFDTGSFCTFKTGSGCTFNTGSDCTFNTGSRCTFDTSYNCTFSTISYCTFSTGSDCTFSTSSYCTFSTSSDCTFKTGSACVIVRRDIFQVIQPLDGDIIKILGYENKGFLSKLKDEDKFYLNGDKELGGYIFEDGILSKVISRKGNVYKLENGYLIKNEFASAHGVTLKEAKEALIYKLKDRDTSKYSSLTLESILSREDIIRCYMTVTGACSFGTKQFVDSQKELKEEYSIQEIIDITRGSYGNESFRKFFEKCL